MDSETLHIKYSDKVEYDKYLSESERKFLKSYRPRFSIDTIEYMLIICALIILSNISSFLLTPACIMIIAISLWKIRSDVLKNKHEKLNEKSIEAFEKRIQEKYGFDNVSKDTVVGHTNMFYKENEEIFYFVLVENGYEPVLIDSNGKELESDSDSTANNKFSVSKDFTNVFEN